MRTHQRYPKILFFFVSAFLSSSRSLTFNIQKFLTNTPDPAIAKKRYEQLRSELLSDPISNFFKERRNVSEKEGYPPVLFSLYKRHYDSAAGRDVWTQLGPKAQIRITAKTLDYIESSLLRGAGPLFPGQDVPVEIVPIWEWEDYPGGVKEVIPACEEYLDRLSSFVAVLRKALNT